MADGVQIGTDLVTMAGGLLVSTVVGLWYVLVPLAAAFFAIRLVMARLGIDEALAMRDLNAHGDAAYERARKRGASEESAQRSRSRAIRARDYSQGYSARFSKRSKYGGEY